MRLAQCLFSHGGMNMETETMKVVLPALIGAGSAIIVFFVKDIILYELRERRVQKLNLLDRRLSQLYAPIFVALKGGEGMLGNIFVDDDKIFEKFTENMHLLGPELYDLAQQYMTLGRTVRADIMNVTEQRQAIDLSRRFNEVFLSEFERLREEYQGGFWRLRIIWKRLTNKST